MNTITALPTLKDNYIWAIHSLAGSQIIVVDPGDASPVLTYLAKNKLSLFAIFLTHKHWDHTHGVLSLLNHFPDVAVYGPSLEKVPGVTRFVKEGDEIALPPFDLTFRVMEIPGHTLGHIAYVSPTLLFCGDTLFSAGCGKIFEGTPLQMYTSLNRIKNLPENTLVFCGHEYTANNLIFAALVEPSNVHLQQRRLQVNELRQRNLPTLPSTILLERQTNPFLRCETPEIIASVQKHCKIEEINPVSIFSHLREWKNNYNA